MSTAVRRFAGPPSQLMVGYCQSCGKAMYASRRDARRAARGMFPGIHHRAVQCGHYWHIERVWGEPR